MWVRAARYLRHHPTAPDIMLAIEVSDSSLKNDLIEKGVLYAEAGIVEYWVVDAHGQCIHVFRDPDARAGTYRLRSVAKIGDLLAPLAPCTTPLDLKDLFDPA